MQYLLERLAEAAEPTPGPRRRFDLRDAVRAQIQRVVSSHFWPAGPGLELTGFVLPPLAGFGYACRPDVERYADGIRALVLAHEPRLAGATVTVAPTGSPLMPFEVLVSGSLPGCDEPDTFRFELPLHA